MVSRSLNRDWRAHAPATGDSEKSGGRASDAKLITAATEAGVMAQESDALPVSWTDAVLLNEKFVKVVVSVAMPNFVLASPSLPQAPTSVISADETTATRQGRATPPPSHMPPCVRKRT